MKLALGTAQFGSAYGIASPQPQINLADSQAIIEYAHHRGMKVLDTAIGYGSSESRLGEIGVHSWKVISKLPEIPATENIADWIFHSVRASLERLKVKSLYGLLLHRPSQLVGDKGAKIHAALQDLKSNGLVEKTGVSIYHPSELSNILAVGKVDLVQSPLSILDRRLISSGWLDRLADHGIEVHARSVFLQGILLMSPDELPRKFDRWSKLWSSYRGWLRDTGMSPLQACLAYVSSIPQVQQVVVGVNGLDHIREILEARIGIAPDWSPDLATDDETLLNPLSWLKIS